MTEEQEEILREFLRLLMGPTKDGARKRAEGKKVHWKQDPSHLEAMYRHLRRYEVGELEDPDSHEHPLVHVAWRALARAYQETHLGWA